MIPGAFDYHRPQSVGDACRLLAELGEDARVIAGGHSLTPMMKLRMAAPEHLVDLQAIPELKGIRIDGSRAVIGAMTTQAELIASRELGDRCPVIRETGLQIADPQIRNLGTIGGNVANGDPGNDMPALMQALDATFEIRNTDGSREVKARAFYQAAFFTALADGDLLTAITFELPAAGHGWSYQKQKRKIGDYATAAAAVILEMTDGRCSKAAIGLTNLADTPLFAEAASAALIGTPVDDGAIAGAADAAVAVTAPASDGRGPAEFRSAVAGVMVARAIRQALGRAR
jgi:aerobic carbon-monoxide dehydrogenase medium subunit